MNSEDLKCVRFEIPRSPVCAEQGQALLCPGQPNSRVASEVTEAWSLSLGTPKALGHRALLCSDQLCSGPALEEADTLQKVFQKIRERKWH